MPKTTKASPAQLLARCRALRIEYGRQIDEIGDMLVRAKILRRQDIRRNGVRLALYFALSTDRREPPAGVEPAKRRVQAGAPPGGSGKGGSRRARTPALARRTR